MTYTVIFGDNNSGDTDIVCGDANCDGQVTMADAASVFMAIGNPDKYALSEKGTLNADCSGNGDGITPSDAIAIQKLIAGLINKFPVKMV